MMIRLPTTGRLRFTDAPWRTPTANPQAPAGTELAQLLPPGSYRLEPGADGTVMLLRILPTADAGPMTPAKINARNKAFWSARR